MIDPSPWSSCCLTPYPEQDYHRSPTDSLATSMLLETNTLLLSAKEQRGCDSFQAIELGLSFQVQ
jgi:hypothetical protein